MKLALWLDPPGLVTYDQRADLLAMGSSRRRELGFVAVDFVEKTRDAYRFINIISSRHARREALNAAYDWIFRVIIGLGIVRAAFDAHALVQKNIQFVVVVNSQPVTDISSFNCDPNSTTNVACHGHYLTPLDTCFLVS